MPQRVELVYTPMGGRGRQPPRQGRVRGSQHFSADGTVRVGKATQHSLAQATFNNSGERRCLLKADSRPGDRSFWRAHSHQRKGHAANTATHLGDLVELNRDTPETPGREGVL